jgi:DNA (cytosine-5)-methyltransferase 1
VILDLYAGADGWGEAARSLGLGSPIGLEIEHDPCVTAVAAGGRRVRCDVATYPTAPFADRVVGVVGSPPCAPWSAAGNRLGERDRGGVYRLVDRLAAGDLTSDWAWSWTSWHDPRSHHAAQPVRWVRDLRPEWVCLEQVPAVLGLWQHIARVLDGWGYATWTGLLNSADYGVPQTRVRAFLVASRVRSVRPPVATHYDPRRGTAMWGTPWVSMAEALGWGADRRPAATVTGGGTGSDGGVEVFAGSYARAAVRTGTNSEHGRGALVPYERSLAEPSPVVTSRVDRWLLNTNRDQREDGARQTVMAERPAPTIDGQAWKWTRHRPATTVAADPRVPAPGHRDRAGGERQHQESIRVSVTEAAATGGRH